MNDQCAAQTPPSTLACRVKMFFRSKLSAVLWWLRMLFARFAYRHVMRLTHYFGWHYAPLMGPIQPDGDMMRWCKWCGMRGIVPNEARMLNALRRDAAGNEGTIPVSLRLQKQLIADLKHIAKIRGVRGYQTLIKQVLSEALAESKPSFAALREVLRITDRDHETWKRAHEELAWLEQRTFP